MSSRPVLVAALLLATLALSAPAGAAGRLAVLEDVTVSGPVNGDVVVLAGDVILKPGARVAGDVVAVLGTVDRQPGAEVAGRIVAVSSVAGLGMRSLGPRSVAEAVALRVLAAGAWLLAVNIVLLLFPGMARTASESAAVLSPEAAVLGLIAALTVFMSLVAALGLGPLAPAVVVALIAVTLALKLIGLAALTARLGALLLPPHLALPVPVRASAALLALLLLRLVPVAGGLLWTAVSVLALGSGVVTAASWKGAIRPLPSVQGTGSQR